MRQHLEGMRVCLVTTGQPSTNPRLVKEADALAEAGCNVHVVAAHWTGWADEMDGSVMARRVWSLTFVDWRRDRSPLLFHGSRIRHRAARKAVEVVPIPSLASAALSRVGPELYGAASRIPAHLYIAHNLGALPVALASAKRNRALAAFDAEDLHSGQASGPHEEKWATFLRATERRLIPKCSYLTAASPLIGDAYRDMCGVRQPSTVLNVFPLRDRPAHRQQATTDGPVRLHWFSQTIGPGRGLEDAVSAMGLLRDYPVELHIRGAWQAGYEERLRRLAADRGLAPDCLRSHDPGKPDDMVRLASEYDIGLALEPSTTLNNDIALSNKIFTYVLAGNAVVATRTTAQRQLLPALGSAATGYDSGDPQSLAEALRPWIVSRHLREGARADAWRLGETRFNWDLEKKTFLGRVLAVAQQRRMSVDGIGKERAGR